MFVGGVTARTSGLLTNCALAVDVTVRINSEKMTVVFSFAMVLPFQKAWLWLFSEIFVDPSVHECGFQSTVAGSEASPMRTWDCRPDRSVVYMHEAAGSMPIMVPDDHLTG
jgi:hypothetical protein